MTEDEIRQIVREELTRLQKDIQYEYLVYDFADKESSPAKKLILQEILNRTGREGFRLVGLFPDFVGIPIVLLERLRPKRD